MRPGQNYRKPWLLSEDHPEAEQADVVAQFL